MTIRILNPLDWLCVMPGEKLVLNGDHERIVKVELNCEAETIVELVHHDRDGEERRTFMGNVKGWEKIEVVADADGYFDFTSEGQVWFWTSDGVVNAVMTEEESFTKLLSRKTRNDHLETIIRQQQAGYDRLLAAQEAERLELERLREEAASAAANAALSGEEQPETPPATAGEKPGEGDSTPPAAPAVPA